MNNFFGNDSNSFMEAENNEINNNPMNMMNPMGMMPFSSMMNPMIFMQQAFFMQFQFMQNMTNMQMQLMKNLMNCQSVDISEGAGNTSDKASVNAMQEGFKLGNLTVPPELLKKFMQMDMTPENLEKLQKMLDFTLNNIPASNDK